MTRRTFIRKITSRELFEQIEPKNKVLIERFLKEKDMRCSSATVMTYTSDLKIFFTWNLLHNENKFYVEIKKIKLTEFFAYGVNELHWGSARFTRVRACLSSLSNFIEKYFDEDYPNFRNVILRTIEPMPNIPVREKSILSELQVNDLLCHLTQQEKYQQACWVALAVASGARSSELLRITTDIIDENNVAFDGIFLETTKRIKTKGRTKQGKLMTKFIIKDLFLPFYKRWMVQRGEIMQANNRVHNALFIKSDGNPISLDSVRCWSHGFSNYLNTPIYPHAFRHYAATYLVRLKIPPQLIKALFGWESVDMVDHYNDLDAKDQEWDELENLKNHLEVR